MHFWFSLEETIIFFFFFCLVFCIFGHILNSQSHLSSPFICVRCLTTFILRNTSSLSRPPPVIVLGSPCTISLGTTPCWNSCFLMQCFPPSWYSLLFWWRTSGAMVLSPGQRFRMTQGTLKC